MKYPQSYWSCPNCGHQNPNEVECCNQCGMLKSSMETFEKNGVEYVKFSIVMERKAEELLDNLALTVLIIGIIAACSTIYFGFTQFHSDEDRFLWLVYGIVISLSSGVIYALLRVISRISDNIHRINIKMDK